LGFFAEFLEETGLFERRVKDCPLAYASPNARMYWGHGCRRFWMGRNGMRM
jgi:hypothetical protein